MDNLGTVNRVSRKVMYIVSAVLALTIVYLFIIFKTSAFYDIDTSSLVDDTFIAWTPTLAVEIARQPEIILNQLAPDIADSTAGVIIPGTTTDISDSTGSGNIVTTGSDAELANYLRTLGYSDFAISGIMGNFSAESGMNAAATQGHAHDGQTRASCRTQVGGDGHGLAQWDSGRRVALINYADKIGGNWWDFSTQMAYFKTEIEGPEKRSGGVDAMNRCSSVTEACFQFAAKYERCAGATGATLSNPSVIHRWPVRLGSSNSYYAWLQSSAGRVR